MKTFLMRNPHAPVGKVKPLGLAPPPSCERGVRVVEGAYSAANACGGFNLDCCSKNQSACAAVQSWPAETPS